MYIILQPDSRQGRNHHPWSGKKATVNCANAITRLYGSNKIVIPLVIYEVISKRVCLFCVVFLINLVRIPVIEAVIEQGIGFKILRQLIIVAMQ